MPRYFLSIGQLFLFMRLTLAQTALQANVQVILECGIDQSGDIVCTKPNHDSVPRFHVFSFYTDNLAGAKIGLTKPAMVLFSAPARTTPSVIYQNVLFTFSPLYSTIGSKPFFLFLSASAFALSAAS